MATRMQQRRGTASQWSTANPILNAGEIGFESDNNKFKIGDGVNHWADLTYFVDGAELANIVDGAPALLDTLNELAAAIGDDPAFMTTVATNLSNHQSDTTSIHGIADTSLLVTTTGTHTLTNKTLTSPKINEDVALTATATELNYVDGVTSAIQTQLNAKAPLESPTFTGTVTLPANTISQSMMGDDSVGTNEIGGLAVTEAKIADGAVTNVKVSASAAIAQSKIDGLTTDLAAKAPLASPTFTGTVTTDDLIVDGDFTVNGNNFAASATSITIEDNLVQLAHQNVANTVDLGIVVGYTESSTAKHSGIVRDVSSDKWKLFKGVTTEPSTTVDFTQGSLDDLELAGLTASSLSLGTALSIANGGTGATTASTAAAALLPSQSSNSGKYLTTDGSGTLSWGTVTGYSAPTLGSTSIASGETVTTIAGLTLSGATLTGSLTAGGGTGTSGQVLASTGSGVQWTTPAAGADEILAVMRVY